jgi:undecaprenyl-phosphate 4-deoxy-4-formamido-L-arabinose transferase
MSGRQLGTIRRLARKHRWVRGISLSRNYGQENATLCGILESRFDIIATMDDDLQHSPEDLPRLLHKLNEGYDVVYGVPRVRRQSWWKTAASAIVKWVISRSMGLSAVRDLSAYKVFRADLRETFGAMNGRDVLIDVLLSWITARFASVEIEEAPRTHGKSNYDLPKLVKCCFLITRPSRCICQHHWVCLHAHGFRAIVCADRVFAWVDPGFIPWPR